MWTDLLAAIWPALPWLFAAGCCFILAGGIGIFLFRRRDVTLGPDPVIPPVHQPVPFTVPSPSPPANYRRPDSDTGVMPHIPGATPELTPQLAAVARYLDAVTEPLPPIEGLREERIEEVPTEVLQRVRDGLAGAVCPSAPKSSDETQVVDLCPLTTQDLVIPTDGDTPVHRAIADREPTQELSARVAKILEASK